MIFFYREMKDTFGGKSLNQSKSIFDLLFSGYIHRHFDFHLSDHFQRSSIDQDSNPSAIFATPLSIDSKKQKDSNILRR